MREAETWLTSPAAAVLSYTAEMQALVEASRQAVDAGQQEREATLQREKDLRQQAEDAAKRAEHQAQVARVQALAAYAVGQINSNRERAALLAAEAVKNARPLGGAPMALAEDTLHRVLTGWLLWRTWRNPTSSVTSAAFSPDGRWVVTASLDRTARRYTVDLNELLEIVSDCVNRGFTSEARVRYLGESYWQAKGEEHLTAGEIEAAVEAFAEAKRRDPQLLIPAVTVQARHSGS